MTSTNWIALTNGTISTHTLTWSVTWEKSTLRRFLNDFNSHAHVERDRDSVPYELWKSHFNSHAHVERDGITKMLTIRTKISTHTLTWSVTDTLVAVETLVYISTHTLTWSVTKANI